MKRITAVLLLAAGAALSQTPNAATVIGEVRAGADHLWGELTVELDAVAGGGISRTYVRPDGSFDLREISPGSFRATVRDARGDAIWQEMVFVAPGTTPLVIEIARPPAERSQTGTISIAGLQQKRFPAAAKELRLAEKALDQGRWQVSIEHLRKAVEAAPQMAAARNNLGATLLRAGAFEDARVELEAAVNLDRDAAIPHANLALALLALERTIEALSEARLALRRDPLQAGANYAAGAALQRAGHTAEALVYLGRAERDAPQALLLEARIFEIQARKPEAAAKLRDYLSRPSVSDRSKVGEWLSRLEGATREAVE